MGEPGTAITIRLTGGPAHGTELVCPAEQRELLTPQLLTDPRDLWATEADPAEPLRIVTHRYVRAHPWAGSEPIPFYHTDLLRPAVD